jgi:hypothetical protein
MMNAQLQNALHTNDVVRAVLVMDRRTLPTDKERIKAANGMLKDSNLLESHLYPINGLLVVEGFSKEVQRMAESEHISTACLA